MKRYKILTPFNNILVECEQCEDHENTVILDNQNKTRVGKSWLKELNLRLEPIEEPKKIKAYAWTSKATAELKYYTAEYGSSSPQMNWERLPELDIESK